LPLVPPASPQDADMEKDIVDTAVADGRFTTLAAALQATALEPFSKSVP